MEFNTKMELNVEKLIYEVSKRPEIWDSTRKSYRDKPKKLNSWKEIYCSLFDDFDEKTEQEKIFIGNMITTKWRTVRDGFVKSKKKERELAKSGKKLNHKYVYSDHLSFLNKCFDIKETEVIAPTSSSSSWQDNTTAMIMNSPPASTMVAGGEENSNNFLISDNSNVYTLNNLAQDTKATTSTFPKISYNGRKRKAISNDIDELHQFDDIKLSSSSTTTATHYNARLEEFLHDEDMSFFRSLLSIVKRLNMTQKLKFRMDVMNSLQTIMEMSTLNITTGDLSSGPSGVMNISRMHSYNGMQHSTLLHHNHHHHNHQDSSMYSYQGHETSTEPTTSQSNHQPPDKSPKCEVGCDDFDDYP